MGVHCPKQQPKVDESLLQLFQHEFRVAAGDVEMDIRVLAAKLASHPGKQPDNLRFPGANVHIPHNGFL